MKIEMDAFKSALLGLFSVPYVFASGFMGASAFRLYSSGGVSSAGAIAAIAVLLAVTGILGIASAFRLRAIPDCMVALHAGVAVLFVVISFQA